MSKLDELFGGNEPQPVHPVVKYLKNVKPQRVEVEVWRAREVLGYKPARIIIHITKDEVQLPPTEYAWDDDLNHILINSGYRAVNQENEKVRFCMALRSGFRKPETRFGEGFFNAVLVKLIKGGPFMEFGEVAGVMKDVSANEPYMRGPSYEDCIAMIKSVLHGRAKELTEALHYDRPIAEDVLAGALARYLDERFTVTDRRRLGWT